MEATKSQKKAPAAFIEKLDKAMAQHGNKQNREIAKRRLEKARASDSRAEYVGAYRNFMEASAAAEVNQPRQPLGF